MSVAASSSAIFPPVDNTAKRKAVARWLIIGVIMLVIQTWLGGITRLTGSGLSITKWQPILGAIPPHTDDQWQKAFDQYQQIGQFKYLNSSFTLSNFKAIYFWEWTHREWARLISIVFLGGFVWFAVKKYFDKSMLAPFILLFVLGAMQGAIGWLMVQSGINPDDLYVSHIALAIHFLSAMVLICYTLWFALQLLIPQEQRIYKPAIRKSTISITALLVVQLTYGAFMAGLKAATTAPTWPTINGQWGPGNITTYGNRTYSGITQFISQPIMVHFMHRTLAYILLLLIVGWAISAIKTSKAQGTPLFGHTAKWPLVLVLIQVTLGILTVLNAINIIPHQWGAFEWLAEAHQLVAMCLLLSLIINIYILRRNPAIT